VIRLVRLVLWKLPKHSFEQYRRRVPVADGRYSMLIPDPSQKQLFLADPALSETDKGVKFFPEIGLNIKPISLAVHVID
jgi:hypothetical protein